MDLPTPPDPNLVYGWLALASLGVSWLVARLRGKKTDKTEALLHSTVRAELESALRNRATFTTARAMMETACYAAASGIGIKPAVAKPFVAYAVELGMAELRRRVTAIIERDLDQLATATKRVESSFEQQ